MCGKCLLRSNAYRIPTGTVRIEDSLEICSQDKCILGSESQVLLDRGSLVDIISKISLQLSLRRRRIGQSAREEILTRDLV